MVQIAWVFTQICPHEVLEAVTAEKWDLFSKNFERIREIPVRRWVDPQCLNEVIPQNFVIKTLPIVGDDGGAPIPICEGVDPPNKFPALILEFGSPLNLLWIEVEEIEDLLLDLQL